MMIKYLAFNLHHPVYIVANEVPNASNKVVNISGTISRAKERLPHRRLWTFRGECWKAALFPFPSGSEGVEASGVQFIFVRRQQRNCTFNQDFYQFARADGAKTKPIVAVTGWGFKCSNATESLMRVYTGWTKYLP